jgi:hypothetical protein
VVGLRRVLRPARAPRPADRARVTTRAALEIAP